MESSIPDDIWYGLICLLGTFDKDWAFYETDPDWWTLHLWTKRN